MSLVGTIAVCAGLTAVLVCGPYQAVFGYALIGLDMILMVLADAIGPKTLVIGMNAAVVLFFIGISLCDL